MRYFGNILKGIIHLQKLIKIGILFKNSA